MPFWTVIIYKLKGYKVRGRTHIRVTGFFKGLLSPNWSGLFQQVESNNTTAKKKKSLNGWFSIQLSLCWASQRFFHWTLCPVILNVIYALYATWTCVSVCMCVCVYFSLPHVFLASSLALSPSPWLACCPCNVTACSALEWESRRAALLVTSCPRAFFYIFNFFSFVDEDRSSLFLWDSSTLGFSFVWLRMRNEPLAPLVFSGGMFSDSGNVFFGKSVGARLHCTAALRAQSLTFYSLKLFCALPLLFLFSFFPPVAYFTFTHQ